MKSICTDHASGEELILKANAISLMLSKCMDNHEISEFCELLGLVRHNMEIIRYRRKVEKHATMACEE